MLVLRRLHQLCRTRKSRRAGGRTAEALQLGKLVVVISFRMQEWKCLRNVNEKIRLSEKCEEEREWNDLEYAKCEKGWHAPASGLFGCAK